MMSRLTSSARVLLAVSTVLAALVVLGWAGAEPERSATAAPEPAAEAAESNSGLDDDRDDDRERPTSSGSADDVGMPAPGEAPAALLELPPSVETALVIDAQANSLYHFENVEGKPRLEREYYVAIGKAGADKRREGDERTPIGLYFVESYLPGRNLPPIYGSGAFPLDYPSAWDKRLGRTGSGIWIHGTDKTDSELVPRSSRGCLTLRDGDFVDLEDSVQIGNTPVIIARSMRWLETDQAERNRSELRAAIEAWRQDWESLDTDAYLSYYHEDFRADGMNLSRWKAHKRRVNAAKKSISVTLSDVGLYEHPDTEGLFVASFKQEYDSDNFRSVREKLQYWTQTEDGWQVIQEASR